MKIVGNLVSMTIGTFICLSLAYAEPATNLAIEPSAQSQSLDASPDMAVSEQKVLIPSLLLLRQDGSKAKFPQVLDDGKPVVLTFIYTTCKAVCPIMSHILISLQNKLGMRAKEIQMASISLDPEYDTPDRLTQYAHQLGAGPQWTHYTGVNDDVVKLEKAFNIYRGDKMNHLTIFFVRRAPGQPWVKMVGFVSPDTIIKQLGLETQSTSETDLPK